MEKSLIASTRRTKPRPKRRTTFLPSSIAISCAPAINSLFPSTYLRPQIPRFYRVVSVGNDRRNGAFNESSCVFTLSNLWMEFDQAARRCSVSEGCVVHGHAEARLLSRKARERENAIRASARRPGRAAKRAEEELAGQLYAFQLIYANARA